MAPSSDTPTPNFETQSAELFFVASNKLAIERSPVSAAAPARQALEQLLHGPKDPQHFSEIPKTSQMEDLSTKDGVATVSFNQGFFTPNGATGTLLRLAQVVYTLTQFSGVASVQFLEDGRSVDLIGEGFPLNRPLTRQEFAHLQP